MGTSGFFKGEKRKKGKHEGGNKPLSFAPTFTPPTVIKKGKDSF